MVHVHIALSPRAHPIILFSVKLVVVDGVLHVGIRILVVDVVLAQLGRRLLSAQQSVMTHHERLAGIGKAPKVLLYTRCQRTAVTEWVGSLRLDRHGGSLAQAATRANIRVSAGSGRLVRIIIRERVDASSGQRRVCKLWIKVGH